MAEQNKCDDAIVSADAPSQAHLQGTQSQQHISQPAKELAFCSAWATVFRLTELICNTLLTDRGKGERTTGGLPKYGLTKVIFSICNSIVLHIQLDIIYLAFCCYLHNHFFNLASVPGGRFSNSPTSQSPVR